jgi:hypothetical protein
MRMVLRMERLYTAHAFSSWTLYQPQKLAYTTENDLAVAVQYNGYRGLQLVTCVIHNMASDELRYSRRRWLEL